MFKQKKLSLGARFGLMVASGVLGILLFASTLFTVFMGNTMMLLDQFGVQDDGKITVTTPRNLEMTASVGAARGGLRTAPRPMGNRLHSEATPEGVADQLTDELIEMFYNSVAAEIGEEFPVSLEEFTQLIEKSTVKDYISEKTVSLIVDYFNGEVTTTFEAEEIVQLVEENKELIEEVTGEEIDDEIVQEVARVFDENEIVVKVEEEGLAGFIDAAGVEIPVVSDVLKSDVFAKVRETIQTVMRFFSPTNLVIGIAVSVVLAAAILLINCKQLGKGMRRVGYPLMLTGTLMAVNIFAMCTPEMWNALPILSQLRTALMDTAWLNITIFCSGLVLFVGGIVVGCIFGKKKEMPAAPAAGE